jgi:hypothetical protein
VKGEQDSGEEHGRSPWIHTSEHTHLSGQHAPLNQTKRWSTAGQEKPYPGKATCMSKSTLSAQKSPKTEGAMTRIRPASFAPDRARPPGAGDAQNDREAAP